MHRLWCLGIFCKEFIIKVYQNSVKCLYTLKLSGLLVTIQGHMSMIGKKLEKVLA